MTGDPSADGGPGDTRTDGPGSPSRLVAVNRACDRFEEEWRAGRRTAVEDFLADAPDRAALLRELLAVEIDLRRSAGERPARGEYHARFPGDAAAVDDAFARADRDSVSGPAGGAHEPGGPRRFRVLRPHARGGLGAVYVALDGELNREVALKEILDRHADDPVSRSRFLVEAEVTGGLEHPGIVPVYGLGTYPDGRPYYAMRFIKGPSLKEAAAAFHADPALAADAGARALALSKLLRRFLDVCNAVDYAHSRGVLHRDIKPGNVVVGRYGETLVVDWGLAKATGGPGAGDGGEAPLRPSSASGGAETLPGALVGTPAYMSPEQASGDLDRLGPWSDVYGLGATLYHLLTGRAPVAAGDVDATLRAVRDGAVTPPRSLDPRVSRALEAVCLKALARRPERRYQTARGLADDVERWLADEPVLAHRERPLERLSRWSRRHRAWTRAGAAALAFAAAAATVAAVAVDAARRREAAALADAERNFGRALRAVDESFTAVSESPELLRPLPGVEPVRRRLLARALDYYREFARDHAGDPRLRAEVARAHLRVGLAASTAGTMTEAVDSLRRAIDLFKALPPAERAARRAELADAEAGLARVLADTGRGGEAAEGFRRAVAVYEELLRSDPARPSVRAGLVTAAAGLGAVDAQLGRLDEAAAALTRAREVAGSPGEGPADEPLRLALYRATSLAARVEAARRNPQGATDLLQSVRTRLEEALRADPRLDEARDLIGDTWMDEGRAWRGVGEVRRAAAAFEAAEAAFDALGRSNPTVGYYRTKQGNTLVDLATVHEMAGDLPAATDAAARAARAHDASVQADPGFLPGRTGQANALDTLGRLATRAGRPDEGLVHSNRSKDLYDRLAAEFPADPRFPIGRAQSRQDVEYALVRLGRYPEAAAAAGEIRGLWSDALARRPGDLDARYNLSQVCSRLATFRERSGDPAGAERFYREALGFSEGLVRQFPDRYPYLDELTTTQMELGSLLLAAARIDEADPLLRGAAGTFDRLAAEHPDEPVFREKQADALTRLGRLLTARGDRPAAREVLNRAVALWTRHAAAFPGQPGLADAAPRCRELLLDLDFPANPFGP